MPLVFASFMVGGVAQASPTCGSSGGHTICVTVPSSTLTGATTVTITNNANNGTVIARWIPQGKAAISLITEFGPSPSTNDYTFVWPTQKYLDAQGVLRVQAGSTSSAAIDVPVTLSNGNASDFQHSPNDWASFLPDPSWTASRDPVVAAVGDGASNDPAANDNADAIAASPDVFLYLGDIYEDGTFTENLNHYGENSMDGGPGTLWGQMGTITQPAIGDHEAGNRIAWQDYFHGRPVYASFQLGNVLFLDLASAGESMAVGSAQYNWVKSILTGSSAPACVIAYFQNPALAKSQIKTKGGRADMWALLTDNGGDLVLNGNAHTMIQYKPLNDKLQLPSSGQPTMVELIAGSGGHLPGGAFTSDSRVEWSKGQTPGAVYITLDGARGGGTPTSLSWEYRDSNGKVLHTGSRDCGGGSPPPPPPGPSISGFNPTSGPVGTSVQITGTGLTGATGVAFGGASAGTYTVDSDSQITATVPNSAATGPISVTTAAGTATSSSDFTVTTSGGGGPLAISGFSPSSGPPGTPVTITGSGFTNVTIVKFNGVRASFNVNSDSQMSATVPSSATTGPIKVKDPVSVATSSSDFTVTSGGGGLAISGFSPSSGPPGTPVTITGSGFTNVTIVKFNGVNASFSVDSDSQITATVPSSATTGPIKVKDGLGAATSSTDFTVT